MPKFSYTVRNRDNRVVTGHTEGASLDEVLDRLSAKDFLPIAVSELNFDGSDSTKDFKKSLKSAFTGTKNKVPYKEVVFFTRQLATLVGEGVPLSRALEQLGKSERPVFKKIINDIAADISSGNTFSDSIARHPGAFNNMYVAVSNSGEIAGALDKVLDEMATYMENVEIMRGKVKAAMRYPIFIACFVTLMIIGIMWKLVPTFEQIYSGLGAKLPAPTIMLISVSHIFKHNIALVFLGMISLFGLYKYLLTQENFKFIFDKYSLQVPVFGSILKKNIWANYCRTMALLMEAGTPILKATEISGAVVSNKLYAKSLEGVYNQLRQGEQLSSCLEKTGLFPSLVIQLASTGEMSGSVDRLLRKAAEFYEREIRNTVDGLSSILEPLLIIVLGTIVGFVMLALYYPIFKIGSAIR